MVYNFINGSTSEIKLGLITFKDDETVDDLGCLHQAKARLSRRMSYLTIGPGTGQPYTNYPQLIFQPKSFFALGSPIGRFCFINVSIYTRIM